MNATKSDRLAETLGAVLTSPNVADSAGEPANLVDVFDEISRCLWFSFAPERGMKRVSVIAEHGEAIKGAARGIEIGLDGIAEAINNLASAIREHGQK